MPTTFIMTPQGIRTLYQDGLDYQSLFPVPIASGRLDRNSHVEPVENQLQFRIVWQEPYRSQFGEETRVNEAGWPFVTKREAELCEIRMIRRYHGLPLD